MDPVIVELRDADRGERPNACCREPQNLRCEQGEIAQHFIELCACGRRHHIMEVDPVSFGVAGVGL